MAVKVAGELYFNIDGQLAEIKRQLRQPNGYPFDPIQLQKFLQRTIEGKFEDVVVVKAIRVLGRRRKVARPTVDEGLDLEAFFQNREGLFVWGNFQTLILQAALAQRKASLVMSTSLSRRLLNIDAKDAEIEGKLGNQYQFSELEAALLIAKMIAMQPAGAKGILLNNGRANLFYTPSCVLYVYWGAVCDKWHVPVCRRGVSRWLAGGQVFSSN